MVGAVDRAARRAGGVVRSGRAPGVVPALLRRRPSGAVRGGARRLSRAPARGLRRAAAAPSPRPPRPAGARRTFLGSRYLGLVLPDTAEVYNVVGAAARGQGRIDDAARAFAAALRLEPASPAARQNLGQIRHEQGRALLEARRFRDAAAELRGAVALLPQSAAAAQRSRRRARLGERGRRARRRSSAPRWRSTRISSRRAGTCRRPRRWCDDVRASIRSRRSRMFRTRVPDARRQLAAALSLRRPCARSRPHCRRAAPCHPARRRARGPHRHLGLARHGGMAVADDDAPARRLHQPAAVGGGAARRRHVDARARRQLQGLRRRRSDVAADAASRRVGRRSGAQGRDRRGSADAAARLRRRAPPGAAEPAGILGGGLGTDWRRPGDAFRRRTRQPAGAGRSRAEGRDHESQRRLAAPQRRPLQRAHHHHRVPGTASAFRTATTSWWSRSTSTTRSTSRASTRAVPTSSGSPTAQGGVPPPAGRL